MSSRALQKYLTILACAALLIAIVGGVMRHSQPAMEGRLQIGDMGGTSVWVSGKEYPLNFKQQLRLVAYLNNCEETQATDSLTQTGLHPIDRLTIFWLDRDTEQWHFSAGPDERLIAHSDGLHLLEQKPGDFARILKETYTR